MEMIQVFKAVRNDAGKIIDFVWILNNATSERIYGNVIGKSLRENYPGVKEIGIFDCFVRVTETGVAEEHERHYLHEQLEGWFYQSAVKLNDGVATTTVNITERKKAELQLKESRDQLRSILDTAIVQMSILEAVRDQKGQIMDFRILAVNRELEKETGRNDLPGKLYAEQYPGIRQTGLFDLIVKAVESGQPQGTEYFYDQDNFYKWFACSFIKLNDGVVATNMDISDRKRAEERLKDIDAEQQREIFRVSLNALEEERYRIAESIHNGLGQVLYGVKISLAGLSKGMPDIEFGKTKTYTGKLLNDAIAESRRISHELMPATLEEFGLKTAIEDICRQLQDGIHFRCKIIGLKSRLEKYMELAIYRTVQELMLNVVKHAQATVASVIVKIEPDKALIRVADDGRGMDTASQQEQGIGLASIKSKVNLLNGKVNISSAPGQGTTIEVIIPIAAQQ